jgi:phosphotriesterase-related protein
MTPIPTATGPVDAAELGFTLAHEHLFVLSSEFQANYPRLWDRSAGVDKAVAQLQAAYDRGVRAIVDMTVIGQGRDIELVRRVAERSPVRVVVATGVYTIDGLPPFLRFRGPGEFVDCPDLAVELLESDVTEGIAGSGVRAAVVKFATEVAEPDHATHRMAAAVAEVHRRTGVPVAVHTNPGNGNGLAAVQLLVKEGVAADRVVIGHAGDSGDLDYLRALAETGCFVGFDRFGMTALAPDEQRVAGLLDLLGRGHAEQLLLSQDNASHIDYLTEEQRAGVYPQWSYLELATRILPWLRREGVADETIETLTVRNPRRFLTGEAPGER